MLISGKYKRIIFGEKPLNFIVNFLIEKVATIHSTTIRREKKQPLSRVIIIEKPTILQKKYLKRLGCNFLHAKHDKKTFF